MTAPSDERREKVTAEIVDLDQYKSLQHERMFEKMKRTFGIDVIFRAHRELDRTNKPSAPPAPEV